WLDRDNGLDAFWPRVRDRPGEGAGLRMHQQDRRPDVVEQRDDGVAVDLLLLGIAVERGKLRGIKGIERGIARSAAARPLGVVGRLRPKLEAAGRDEALLGALKVGGLDRALGL